MHRQRIMRALHFTVTHTHCMRAGYGGGSIGMLESCRVLWHDVLDKPKAIPSDMGEHETVDAHGRSVGVGSLVRVLAIDASAFVELDKTGSERLLSMQGQVFSVYEVDPYGRAWVEKWWHEGAAHATSHSIALDPQHMELCCCTV